MKTIREIESLIYLSKTTGKRGTFRYIIPKSKEKHVRNLQQLIRYLETKPTEKFVEKERNRLETILKNKKAGFKYWSSFVCHKDIPALKRYAVFRKENDFNNLETQLKYLNILLR